MDQERNPNRNAELSMEQNYNQIDGIINNLPVPLPEEKHLSSPTPTPIQGFSPLKRTDNSMNS